jgi:hypothetical protein
MTLMSTPRQHVEAADHFERALLAQGDTVILRCRWLSLTVIP